MATCLWLVATFLAEVFGSVGAVFVLVCAAGAALCAVGLGVVGAVGVGAGCGWWVDGFLGGELLGCCVWEWEEGLCVVECEVGVVECAGEFLGEDAVVLAGVVACEG